MRLPLLLLGLISLDPAHAQTTHLLRAQDFFFLPDTVVMVAGDSLKFQTQQGPHNIMQVDQPDWLANQPVGNGGFHTVLDADTTFAIDTAGTYYFVCEPHGFMGMKGVLLVAPNGPTSTAEKGSEMLRVFPNPAAEVLFIQPPSTADPIADVVWIDALGIAHPIAFSIGARSITCVVGGLPRGPGVLRIRCASRWLQRHVLLH